METNYDPFDQIYRDYLTFFCIKKTISGTKLTLK